MDNPENGQQNDGDIAENGYQAIEVDDNAAISDDDLGDS